MRGYEMSPKQMGSGLIIHSGKSRLSSIITISSKTNIPDEDMRIQPRACRMKF
jgi:hypothetical protein